ncbi:MAG: 4Fe-4S binding protein [Desulfuromonadales bacterium]|nr:4Fe-4S binding protein [Desulfuromonadales bacterium]
MSKQSPLLDPFKWRLIIQWLFFAWCLFIGVQFGLFVRHFESGGQAAYYPRPPSVEAFLPIGALVSLKSWLATGWFDPVHPAALVLFLTFIGMAFLARKSFCSFICPVGTLSEGAWKLGRLGLGRNFHIWFPLDLLLRSVKYLLLFWFTKIVLIDMPGVAARAFLNAPYWAIADVKMLHFFTRISITSLVVIAVLVLLSLIYKNFWCRYLCPYGALLGLVSLFSPLAIRRSEQHCSRCGACSRACPAEIDVRHKQRVWSPLCTGCLTCVSRCPAPGALSMSVGRWPISGRLFVGLVALLFSGGVLTGMLSGHWQTSLSYDDYQRLIPLAAFFGH